MILENARKTDVIQSFLTLDPTSNEATRSHKVIGVLLTHIVKQDPNYDFLCQNIDGGLITDFEVIKGKTLIHIVEAKISLGLDRTKDQLEKYLVHRGCARGCISDGYIWQFYELTSEGLKRNGKALSTEFELDEIVRKITE